MHRSSESIASLAAALAKAQAELVNPEKSLVGTIKSAAGETAERLFRYASLSSGLEIVRKTLGQHEIATVQTTAIDQTAGTVNLTTVLAHASGQWIASDWPVCAVADTSEPHRMGAALTYARRYALFTLVGIAGEDDLDAPDLIAPGGRTGGHLSSRAAKGTHRGGNGLAAAETTGHRSGKPPNAVAKPILGPQQSEVQRDQLLAELDRLESSDAATAWAHRVLGVKNSLTARDARRVEDAFQMKLATLEDHGVSAVETFLSSRPSDPTPDSADSQVIASNVPVKADRINKSELTFPEPRRIRNKAHLKFVAEQPCLICGRRPSDAHHLRFMQPRALGLKASDEFTVPLCRIHHRAVHRASDEQACWQEARIDPLNIAQQLWQTSRMKDGLMWPDLTQPLIGTKQTAGLKAAENAPKIRRPQSASPPSRTKRRLATARRMLTRLTAPRQSKHRLLPPP
jgi:ERF superfamily